MKDKQDMNLKEYFIQTVAEELNGLNGTDFEKLCLPLIEIITEKDFILKGHNLEMKPVKAASDFTETDDYRIIGQCGTDKKYFSGTKPIDDLLSSKNSSPDFETIYLFCNRRAKGKEFQVAKKKIDDKLKNDKELNTINRIAHLFDSQLIANTIYSNRYKTEKINQILSYLPISKKYYSLFPKSNSLPSLKTSYKHRPEENEIEKKLEDRDYIQIYGLSGIGKSQLSIAVANNLSKKFDSILWFDEKCLLSDSFKSVFIEKLDASVDLSNILKNFKVLIIADNHNENIPTLLERFNEFNEKGSKLIVTSLQKNVSPEESYQLGYVSQDLSNEILCDCAIEPTHEQVDQIVSQIKGYPLLLELSKKLVENDNLSWDDILQISNLTEIPDNEKNIIFAQRIVGHYKERYSELFNLLVGLNATTVSKPFLKEKNVLKLKSLFNSAILQDDGIYNCTIHQIVLEAIKTVVGKDYSESDFINYILHFLQNHILRKDKYLTLFVSNHRSLLLDIEKQLDKTDKLRHLIVLAYIYLVDTHGNPSHYISLVDNLTLNPETEEIDLRLLIEKLELEQKIIQKKIKKGNDWEELKSKIIQDIKILKCLSIASDDYKALIAHHIGKWWSSVEEYEKSEPYLLEALSLKNTSYRSMLRLARDYHKRELWDKTSEKVDSILGNTSFDEIPLSVRLGAYDIIGNKKYQSLREKYIDKRIDQFVDEIYVSISEQNSQTYVVLSKLSGHLLYNFPEIFTWLCAELPIPLDIDKNSRLRKDYGRILLAQYRFGEYATEEKEKFFIEAEKCFTSIPKKDDFLRKDLIYLYLAAGKLKEAQEVAYTLENQDSPFNQQILSKVYYENEEYEKAIDYIDKAISQDIELDTEYRAAFRHDKAKSLQKMNDTKAVDVMKEAIHLQTNPKLVNEWTEELGSWKKVSNSE